MGGIFFSFYYVIYEILKLFPVNMLEVIFSGDTSAPSPIGNDPKENPKKWIRMIGNTI